MIQNEANIRSLINPQRFQKSRTENSISTRKQPRTGCPGKTVLGREAGVRKGNISYKKPRAITIFCPYSPESPGQDPWELSYGQTGMEPELKLTRAQLR